QAAKGDGQPFDIALMDVQMPEMGGFEATGHVRAWEKQHGGHLPILAMTAHAMKGDRERCLAAGMDGSIAKPIQLSELWQAIDAALPAAAATPSAPGGPVVDRAAVLARTGGDRELLQELIEIFRGDYPRHLADIKAAVAAGDAARLNRSAHALKGAASM